MTSNKNNNQSNLDIKEFFIVAAVVDNKNININNEQYITTGNVITVSIF